MSFPFNLYVLAFGSGLLTTALSMPIWRRWAEKIGLIDDPGHRKIHETPVPLSGGLGVLTGLLVPLVIGILLFRSLGLLPSGALTYGIGRRKTQLLAILIGAIGMIFIGLLDDKFELRPHWKFAGQVLIATMVAAVGVRITLFVPNPLFSYAITILWILTLTNAVNFLDNMNGLCAGIGIIATWCFAWGAAVQGQYLVALIALLTCGALLGFLPFNFPRATAFLGDAGSHLVGFLLAVLGILPHFYSSRHPNRWAVLSPLVVLAVPLGDLVGVVLWRWRMGKPIYVGDTNHISHRLVRLGCSRTLAVLLIWLAAAIIGAAGVLLL